MPIEAHGTPSWSTWSTNYLVHLSIKAIFNYVHNRNTSESLHIVFLLVHQISLTHIQSILSLFTSCHVDSELQLNNALFPKRPLTVKLEFTARLKHSCSMGLGLRM